MKAVADFFWEPFLSILCASYHKATKEVRALRCQFGNPLKLQSEITRQLKWSRLVILLALY